jgi:hypothetical protein
MSKLSITRSISAVAITAVFVGFTATKAAAQNPFSIDGIVTDANNSGVAGALRTVDLDGNSKELGPTNGSSTKFPVIDTAGVPMLDFTNPNASVDLHIVYTQTRRAVNGDIWFYFGWTRDSNNGSGFISFEAHQHANSCASYSTADLLNCNPWSPRTVNDFAIFWDQSGNSTNVYLRKWDGSAFQPSQPGLLLNTFLDGSGHRVVFAQYNSDFTGGEMALNLTGAGIIPPNVCQAFPNVIPGTITGNSAGDQADFKDVVLAAISINTCGAITVTKITEDPSGATVADSTNNFSYTISDGGAVFDGNGDTSISRTIKGCTASAPSPCNGPVITHDGLFASSNYTLTEATPPSPYQLISIACGGTDITGGGTFSVADSGTTACVITNKVPKATPGETTTQTGAAQLQLADTVNITGILSGSPTAKDATATFKLYSDNTCTTLVGSSGPTLLTYANGGTTASASVPGNGISIDAGHTYYWTVTYSGDTFNTGFTSRCGQETGSGTVTFTFVGQGQ